MTTAGRGEVMPLAQVSVVDEGGQVVAGNPGAGVFVVVPPVGGVVIRALKAGASVAEAAAEAQRFAGQPVEVAAFLERLRGLGILPGPAGGGGRPGEAGTGGRPRRTAAIQQRLWLRGPAPATVAWMFGPVAWAVYAALALFDIGVLTARPELVPHARAAYLLVHAGAGPSLVLLFPFVTALVAVHECGHWLAARAAGLSARLGIDYRMYFVVFETDLSQLWSLPRRQRFGPLLAGLAADATVLALLLATQLGEAAGWWALPAFAAHLPVHRGARLRQALTGAV